MCQCAGRPSSTEGQRRAKRKMDEWGRRAGNIMTSTVISVTKTRVVSVSCAKKYIVQYSIYILTFKSVVVVFVPPE